MTRFHVIDLFGEPFFVDSDDSLGLLESGGVYEPYESSLIREVVKGKKCLDIGAHIGYYTRLMVDAGAEGVMAFEPNPLNYGFLLANTATCPNVGRFNVALSTDTGDTELFVSPINSGDDSLVVLDRSKYVEMPIREQAFDDWNSFDLDFDVAKIDVQGWELKVLQGMRSQLERGALSHIFIEYYGDGLRAAGLDGREVLALLWLNGYRLSEIREGEKKLVPIEDMGFVSREDLKHGYTNILAMRE